MPNFTGTPDGWKQFTRTVKRNFPGAKNAVLRKRIYALADTGDGLGGLVRTIAFTASGRAGIEACDHALADWDGRTARREQAAHHTMRD